MSGILQTNAIQTVAGKPILNSTGSVLQVVATNTVGSDGDITTSSSAYVTTGLTATITPLSASSKLFVQWSGNVKFYALGADVGDDGIALKIYRDGAAITTSNENLFYRSDANSNNQHSPATINQYVNANSTSPTTFALYFCDQWGGTAYIARGWGTNQLTIWEISA
jgi:hypothetical protein